MIDGPVAVVARETAAELAPLYGTRVEAEVEAAIYDGGERNEPTKQFVDPVALGSLIVSIAGLAWQIYCDKKKEGNKPARDALIRMVRVRQRESSDLTGAEEKIVEVVAAEIIKAAGDDE